MLSKGVSGFHIVHTYTCDNKVEFSYGYFSNTHLIAAAYRTKRVMQRAVRGMGSGTHSDAGFIIRSVNYLGMSMIIDCNFQFATSSV